MRYNNKRFEKVINEMTLRNLDDPDDLTILEVKPSRAIRTHDNVDKRKRELKEAKWDKYDD